MQRLTAVVGALLAGLAAWGAAGVCGEAAGRPAARPAGVPGDAPVWLVVPAPKASIERAKKLVEIFQPGAGAMVELAVRQGLPWAFEEADESAPMIATLSFPKEDGEPGPWAISGALKAGTDCAAALEKRFGAKPTKTEDGVSTFTEVQEGAAADKEVFAAVKGARVILGTDLAMVKKLAAADAPAAGAYPPDVDLLGGLDVKLLAVLYKDKIEEGLKEFETGMAEGAPPIPGLAVDSQKLLAAVGKLMADRARLGLKEVEQLGWQLRLGGEAVVVGYSARAAAGGSLAGWLTDMEKADLSVAKLLPEGGLLSMAVALPPERLAGLVADLAKPVGEALADDEKLKKACDEITALLVEYLKVTDGRNAMTMLRREQGMCWLAVAGVKNQAATREVLLKLFKLYVSGPMADMMAKSGLKYSIKEKARESGGLAVDQVTAEFSPPAELDVERREALKKTLEAVYGLPMVQEMAVSKDRQFVASGKGSAAALDELIARAGAGKPPGAAEAMAGTLKSAPKGAFVAGELYLLGTVKWVLDMAAQAAPGAVPPLDLGKEAEKTPVTGFLAAGEGELRAELRVPVDALKRLADGFKAMMGGAVGPAPALPDDGGAVPLPAPVAPVE